ncbi:DUF6509 family protein [Paenibacillus mucilaginosus]|uniref:Pullulanase n=3 Tax=Paenibacillus mucilaginosus TaxID=61624 RepID=H6NHI9_9BACL|nr:DUF6509 family protein [Paenibacillus mucilaginosus]AEI41008.1 hypothetical protein KNP414_02447 [Paenibacillus mucilaginosus KNP414]AFC29586.1 hypothetical protein PM3016_2706 [Paenibacillus mucilaginosus 3016]AFH61759.1 hypothetical protein B2K_13705 [Paenibacillus mucilaginosus K02]MCG7211547.1 DUF6509 family protein [Paenibacillus mucilaginosus]WDM31233.1 pullulanase [Paenibacillus mucilaginosus]
MFSVTEYSVEKVKDPFGIIEGQRYEFRLDLEVEEDDELYSEQGVYVRVIYGVAENRSGIVKYDLYERSSDKYLEFDLEDEEVQTLELFCKERLQEAE